jgi:hypothetical protein
MDFASIGVAVAISVFFTILYVEMRARPRETPSSRWEGGAIVTPPAFNAPSPMPMVSPPAEVAIDGTFNPAADPEILAALQKGNKVVAIKRLREVTNLGLAEAKNIIENLEVQLKQNGML